MLKELPSLCIHISSIHLIMLNSVWYQAPKIADLQAHNALWAWRSAIFDIFTKRPFLKCQPLPLLTFSARPWTDWRDCTPHAAAFQSHSLDDKTTFQRVCLPASESSDLLMQGLYAAMPLQTACPSGKKKRRKKLFTDPWWKYMSTNKRTPPNQSSASFLFCLPLIRTEWGWNCSSWD